MSLKDQSGPLHWNWKGGVKWTEDYCYIWKPGYHRASRNYAKRADLVLEEKLGRLLVQEEVAHHINGDRSDDSPDNLEAINAKQHQADHAREGAMTGVFEGSHSNQSRDTKGRFK
jgi:hypothetical protein